MAQNSPQETARDRSGLFQPGVSGNPGGRPKGSRRVFGEAIARLARAEALAVFRAIVARAKEGDAACAVLVLDRAADLGRC